MGRSTWLMTFPLIWAFLFLFLCSTWCMGLPLGAPVTPRSVLGIIRVLFRFISSCSNYPSFMACTYTPTRGLVLVARIFPRIPFGVIAGFGVGGAVYRRQGILRMDDTIYGKSECKLFILSHSKRRKEKKKNLLTAATWYIYALNFEPEPDLDFLRTIKGIYANPS